MLHTLLIAFSMSAAPANTTAWSGDAHRLVCEIAWRRLTPEAKRLATQLRQGESGTFSESCTWADEIVDDRPETYAYHFINIPSRRRGVDMSRDCPAPKRCVPWAIKHFTLVLADSRQSRTARAEALKYVAHFVADVHQPLHAGRPEDRGGNRTYVSFFGDDGSGNRRMQLHSIWDNRIFRRANVRWPASAGALSAGISADEARTWANSDVIGWTNESYRLNEDFVYTARPGSDIANTYYDRALEIATQRLQQAGVRLAFLLNEAARGRTSFTF